MSSSPSTKESSDDDKPPTVAGLFADSPDWLLKQLEVYRTNPAKHKQPLCTAVAAVVLEDGARASKVEGEVEKALEEEGIVEDHPIEDDG